MKKIIKKKEKKKKAKKSFFDNFKSWDWGKGSENTSNEVDKIVYGKMQE